jgi:hypothetical protein
MCIRRAVAWLITLVVCLPAGAGFASSVRPAAPENRATPGGRPKRDEGKRLEEPASDTLTITMSGEVDAELAPVAGGLTTLFYQCYPELLERFDNPQKPASRHIEVIFKRGMKAPAHCLGAKISVSVEWLKKHPDDIGLLTHELTHAVQQYPRAEPGWLTEGIADYARELYGPNEASWSSPRRLTATNSYKDSYQVTARFLGWLDRKHPGAVDRLHRKTQNREFTVDDFKAVTGKTVDELWAECVDELNREARGG